MRVYLVLGCWGREEKEIVMCTGIENQILDISLKSERNLKIVDHLDNVYGMIDRPLYNNVHTAIFSIENAFGETGNLVFQKEKFEVIEDFCILHKKCGIYLRLDMKE